MNTKNTLTNIMIGCDDHPMGLSCGSRVFMWKGLVTWSCVAFVGSNLFVDVEWSAWEDGQLGSW